MAREHVMSLNTEAPALIQYACERCKTRFVLPPSSRKLSPIGRIKATLTAIGRTIRYHEGYSVTYDGVRRQMLAKMDDDAYQSFVQSFKFCHECRQFVCSECWSNSRKTCLGCFAKAAGTSAKQKPPYAPEGPAVPRPVPAFVTARRKRRVSTQASTAAAGVTQTGTPEATATADETPVPGETPTPTATPTPTPTPTPTETPTPTPTPTPRPPTPRPPTPTPFPTPKITCAPTSFTVPSTGTVNCTWTNYVAGVSTQWYWQNGLMPGTGKNFSFEYTTDYGPGNVQLKVDGGKYKSNTVAISPA
jgi:hypothetical protein